LSLDMNAYLSFNRSIEKHNINAQAGLNLKQSGNTSISAQYSGFPSGTLHSSNYAREIVGKPNSSEDTNRLVGFLAALNYSYDNIYLLDASCRIDGSSAFGTNKKFAPFWSVGVGLNLHNYKFMENLSCINQFKVRATYGQTGKVNFPAYAARTTYEVLSDEWFKTGYGVALKAMGNKNLTWETTNTIDAGFELEMFKNMFYVKFSYYDKKTIDLINDVTIPSGSGFTTYIDNIGEVSNKGYEIDLRLNLIRKKEMNLNVNANFAHNKNKILKIAESLKAYNREVQSYQENKTGGVKTAPFTQYIEGGSLNSIWGMRSMGINPSTGEEVFILADGTSSDVWKASNQMVLGSNDPYAQGTFGVNFSYKQFSFYTSFMFEFGGQRYNSTLVNKVENANPYIQNVDKRLLSDRWEKPGDNAKFKKLESGRTGVHQTQATSRFVQDYNMLSWNSLSIGYDLPGKLLEKIYLTMVRFEVGANDILHLSSVKQERGLQYPFARTINFSVKITI
ncbi:MAG: TonB-dependent receptor, partial [Rikenellaceae bacterium]